MTNTEKEEAMYYKGKCGAVITAALVGDTFVLQCENGQGMQCESNRWYAEELCLVCTHRLTQSLAKKK